MIPIGIRSTEPSTTGIAITNGELEVGQVQAVLQRGPKRTEHAPGEEAHGERRQCEAQGDGI